MESTRKLILTNEGVELDTPVKASRPKQTASFVFSFAGWSKAHSSAFPWVGCYLETRELGLVACASTALYEVANAASSEAAWHTGTGLCDVSVRDYLRTDHLERTAMDAAMCLHTCVSLRRAGHFISLCQLHCFEALDKLRLDATLVNKIVDAFGVFSEMASESLNCNLALDLRSTTQLVKFTWDESLGHGDFQENVQVQSTNSMPEYARTLYEDERDVEEFQAEVQFVDDLCYFGLAPRWPENAGIPIGGYMQPTAWALLLEETGSLDNGNALGGGWLAKPWVPVASANDWAADRHLVFKKSSPAAQSMLKRKELLCMVAVSNGEWHVADDDDDDDVESEEGEEQQEHETDHEIDDDDDEGLQAR